MLSSGAALWAGEARSSLRGGGFQWVYSILHATLSLSVLWYVLQRRRLRFSDIGLRWSPKELLWGVLLFVAGMAATWLVYAALFAVSKWLNLDAGQPPDVGGMLFGGHVGVIALLYVFINPFFEELIVRAYLITELKALTNSVKVGVAVSVILQTSYHFYQGPLMALSYLGIFLVFSIYYARTGRIGAPIVAHLIMDLGATLAYMRHS